MNLEDRVASRAVTLCNMKILYTIGIVAFIFALTGVIVGAIAKKEAEQERAVNDLLQDGVLKVAAPIESESIYFKNDFTENISDKRIEFVEVGVSIRFETETNFQTSQVSAGNFKVVANRLSDFVMVHINEWEGTCTNESITLNSKDTIPAEFVAYDGESFIASPYKPYPTVNNGKYQTGLVYVSANGNLIILPNEEDLEEKWSGNCSGLRTDFLYLAYV
jgi:hypothetical protein